MTLLTVLLPSVTFLNRGEIMFAFLALFLQITVVGWLVATAWAFTAQKNQKYNKRVSQYNF
jgi:hypothetical protein